jgi:hypothetical protein
MKLSIEGRPFGAGVNQLRVRNAAKYMLGSLLMTEDPSRYMSISVQIRFIPNFQHDYGIIAQCNWTDDRLCPSAFYIDFDDSLSEKPNLITLGHELTHIKQMAFGHRQESLDGSGMRWMGMLIRPEDLHYYDLPWEIEAHGREYGLYDRFIQYEQGVVLPPATIVDPVMIMRLA